MKKLVLVIMLIFVLALIEGCSKKEKVEEPSKKESVEEPTMVEPKKIEELTTDGQKSMEGNFIGGKMNGTWRTW